MLLLDVVELDLEHLLGCALLVLLDAREHRRLGLWGGWPPTHIPGRRVSTL
jgi:hypothetical protein